MTEERKRFADLWKDVGPRFMPFADAASTTLPLGRLLRLSLFQVSCGMALALLNGVLNRVMIVELGVAVWLVSIMAALPLVFAPFRALIGYRSDTYRSYLGWKRTPFIFFGSMLQFGGLAIMPFALLVLSEQSAPYAGEAGAALAFLMIGAGLHTTQTAGLALATDIAPEETRPRVVALLYVMLLVGMAGSALVFGWLFQNFSQLRLIQVIQGAAVVTMVLNCVALWKQEVRNPAATRHDRPRPAFRSLWAEFMSDSRAGRLLVATFLGTAAFSMQDILLEPYGGEVLGLSVSQTTMLTAIFAMGALGGFAVAGRLLARGREPHRMASHGLLVGIAAFSAVIFADPLGSDLLFRCGAAGIGFGGGLFAVGTLISAMDLASSGASGLALGAWGAVQATAAGGGIALAGILRDVVTSLAEAGDFGPPGSGPALGYSVVYHLEIALLFATLAAIGPLARRAGPRGPGHSRKFGVAEFPI